MVILPEYPSKTPFAECFFVEGGLSLRGLRAMMSDWPSMESSQLEVHTSLSKFHFFTCIVLQNSSLISVWFLTLDYSILS